MRGVREGERKGGYGGLIGRVLLPEGEGLLSAEQRDGVDCGMGHGWHGANHDVV